jgi:hypothetical protein
MIPTALNAAGASIAPLSINSTAEVERERSPLNERQPQ